MPYSCSPEARNRTIGLCIEKAWAVHLVCANGHSARWNVSRLAEDFAPTVTLDEIAERLVCKVCGATDGSLSLRQDQAVTQARDIAAKEAEEQRKASATGRPAP